MPPKAEQSSASAANGKPPGDPTVKEALDILMYDDTSGIRLRKLVVDLNRLIQNPDFAEEFLEADGLETLISMSKTTSGSLQGYVLQIVRGLLVYVNAMDQVADSPELVGRLYHLLSAKAGEPINLSVAKPTLEILIVICGTLPDGHKLINQAAKRRVGTGIQPYALLIPLLSCTDLITVRNTLLFMNIMIRKRKEISDIKAKKLFFRWKECGILSMLKPLITLEDEAIAKQLTVFQKITNFTIPRSWEEASKYKQQYEDMKHRYDTAAESLFVYQQQQARMRLLKAELAKAHEAIRMISVMDSTKDVSTQSYPQKRFADGGGIPLNALSSSAVEQLDVAEASADIAQLRQKIFEKFAKNEEFKPIARKLFPPPRMPAASRRHVDPFAADDDDLPPPPDDDMPPPPDDDDEAPPPDDDLLPPPDDDDDLPPPDNAEGPPKEGDAAKDPQSKTADAAKPQLGEQKVTATEGEAAKDQPAGQQPEGAAQTAAASATDAQQPAATESTAPVTTAPSPPRPPPPPPPKFGGGAPPPPKFGFFGASVAPKDTRQYYFGKVPQKKMKPLHWDKLAMPTETSDSLWHLLHDKKDINCDFDFDEFESMFSMKEADRSLKDEGEEKKEQKVVLLDSKTFMNVSIMLHKLPTIPIIQRGLLELDSDVLSRDGLVAIIAQVPTPEIKKEFLVKAAKKPLSEYEPPEQFVAMALSLPEFKRRCQAWLFSLEWDENAAAVLKPIARLHAAFECILASKFLPYYLGLLLGFGNMMNHGNSTKGNVPAIAISTLSKLEASKDNRGKVSLLQYLINTVKKYDTDALDLHDELKPLFNNVQTLKMDDMEKSVTEAENALRLFQGHCNAVKKALASEGADSADDPFVPKMAEFYVDASKQLEEIRASFASCKECFVRVQRYLGYTEKKPIACEQLFADLIPFVERVKKDAVETAKERKRSQKKGVKLDSHLGNVVGRLQEEMVQS